jgi:sugar phosphate isomerase/epimerase
MRARDLAVVRSLAEQHRLQLAMHFAFGSNHLADLNQGHRRESLRQLDETIRACRQMGADVLVLHSGKLPLELPSHQEADYDPRVSTTALREVAIEALCDSLGHAAEVATRHEVTLALENLGHSKGSLQTSYVDLLGWVQAVGSPRLRVCLDVGHAHLEGSVQGAVEMLGPDVVHVHLDDNDGTRSEHGELGTGTVPWADVGPFLRSFAGMASLEVLGHDDPEGAIIRSRLFLERLLDGALAPTVG